MHCKLNATDNGALTSSALTEKRWSALAERIAREQVVAEADFAHHVGSNTLRLDLSCSLWHGIGTCGMTLFHYICTPSGSTKCAAHLLCASVDHHQMRPESVDEHVQLGPMR